MSAALPIKAVASEWTASPRCISVYTPDGYELLACAPYGMAGTKKWAANAQMMAAAPVLLAALQTAEMCILGYTTRNAVINKALDDCRAAIAKAGQP